MAESAEKINLLVTVPLPEEMLADIRAVSSRIRLTPFFTRKAEEVPADAAVPDNPHRTAAQFNRDQFFPAVAHPFGLGLQCCHLRQTVAQG